MTSNLPMRDDAATRGSILDSGDTRQAECRPGAAYTAGEIRIVTVDV